MGDVIRWTVGMNLIYLYFSARKIFLYCIASNDWFHLHGLEGNDSLFLRTSTDAIVFIPELNNCLKTEKLRFVGSQLIGAGLTDLAGGGIGFINFVPRGNTRRLLR